MEIAITLTVTGTIRTAVGKKIWSKIPRTRGSKMPQKAGCAGRNKVSDCCNYI